MQEIKHKVMELLNSYSAKKRKIEQLKYELEHPSTIGEKEMLESLSFGSRSFDEDCGHNTNHISNKTMMIALQYQDKVDRINSETIAAIMQELQPLELEIERLEYYISLLNKLQEQVIRLFYFEGMVWGDMEKELHISKRTLMNHREEAVRLLVKMYSYIEGIKNKNN